MRLDAAPTQPWWADGRYETGEPPPVGGHRIFVEHMNTLAQRGTGTPIGEPGATGRRFAAVGRRRGGAGLSPQELAEAERVWARLPDWNELVRAS